MDKQTEYRLMSNAIRVLAMDGVQAANSGHPGMPMGMADVATQLFAKHLKFHPQHPDWPDRDRFILSAGHGSMLLYALLHLTGYRGASLDALKGFRQLGQPTAGHPEYGHLPGIETTTGPLAQGLANAVGMAMAERHLNAEFGDGLVDHRTWVIAGDGCLMEGLSQEAITLAGWMKLGRLCVLWDDNDICIDGEVSATDRTDQLRRFQSAGWKTRAIDGHDPSAISRALNWAKKQEMPTLIACKTMIAYGAPTKAGTSAAHGAPLGDEEIRGTRAALDWSGGPFEIPDEVYRLWKRAARRGGRRRRSWVRELKGAPRREEFEQRLAGELPAHWNRTLRDKRTSLQKEQPKMATRVSSGKALESLVPSVPAMIGGSADLTGSNKTLVSGMALLGPENYQGRYIHYGIREHAMAAIMNGMSLHGGIIPYGGTFLVFSDYMRGAMRLSALMQQKVIYVLTHDSIGVGEDGPTHQPVEHLAALRAIPGLRVFRPGDAVEVSECWELALQYQGPSALILTRQGLPTFRGTSDTDPESRSALGAYIVGDGDDITILATGSELEPALEAREKLAARQISARIVSMPCWEIFAEQSVEQREQVLGRAPRIAVEAAIRQGWDQWIGPDGEFIGMRGFGASAPAADLYQHFGITSDKIAEAAERALKRS